MRVALLSTFHERCGIATYSEPLRSALIDLGVAVDVIAPRLKRGEVGEGEQPPRMWNRNRAFGFEAFAVHRALLQRSIDLVHLQVNLSLFSSRFAFTLGQLCARSGLPMVVTLHGRKSGSWGPDFKWTRLLFAFRRADIIVHTESHRAELRRERVHVVAHGMEPVHDGDRAAARAQLGIPSAATVLTHFGFLVRDKGVDDVMRAVAELRSAAHPHLFYDVCGAVYASDESRSYFAELSALSEQLKLRDAVRLTGDFVDDERMLCEMHASDWIVLNYRTGNGQGASGAVRRALSSGRPVAVSAAPVFDDVRPAVHTLKGPLPAALDELLRDRALAELTRERARTFCEQHSWQRIAEQHLAIYRELCARTPRLSGSVPKVLQP
jgi:glycosyltransferase involved in cell wall biosynthesis